MEIEIGVPFNFHESGINYPLFYIEAQALESIFRNNPYAEIVINDQVVNYYDLLLSDDTEWATWRTGSFEISQKGSGN